MPYTAPPKKPVHDYEHAEQYAPEYETGKNVVCAAINYPAQLAKELAQNNSQGESR